MVIIYQFQIVHPRKNKCPQVPPLPRSFGRMCRRRVSRRDLCGGLPNAAPFKCRSRKNTTLVRVMLLSRKGDDDPSSERTSGPVGV